MYTYVAFLRGINVGGNGLIKMTELQDCFTQAGFADVRTYIQSGNVIFKSNPADQADLTIQISALIHKRFNLSVAVAVFSGSEWIGGVKDAPEWWGKDETWKHNILIMTEPYDTDIAVLGIGALAPDIETVVAGNRVIYQSVSREHFSLSRSAKISSLPIYKKMTVRNFNTATKLLSFLE